jgi:hypothetical protein
MPALPRPARRQGEQMSYDGHDKAHFDCYDSDQMHAFRAEGVREVLERAAQACEAMHEEDRPGDYAYAIRALAAEIQPPQKADTQ